MRRQLRAKSYSKTILSRQLFYLIVYLLGLGRVSRTADRRAAVANQSIIGM
jgi:hypothetical protein